MRAVADERACRMGPCLIALSESRDLGVAVAGAAGLPVALEERRGRTVFALQSLAGSTEALASERLVRVLFLLRACAMRAQALRWLSSALHMRALWSGHDAYASATGEFSSRCIWLEHPHLFDYPNTRFPTFCNFLIIDRTDKPS